MITNSDNYYIPKAIEILTNNLQYSQPDIMYFDMVHSHHFPGMRPQLQYCFFETKLERDSIDIGAAIVKTSLAKAVGFTDKSHSADATYFEDLVNYMDSQNKPTEFVKIHQILFVHN